MRDPGSGVATPIGHPSDEPDMMDAGLLGETPVKRLLSLAAGLRKEVHPRVLNLNKIDNWFKGDNASKTMQPLNEQIRQDIAKEVFSVWEAAKGFSVVEGKYQEATMSV